MEAIPHHALEIIEQFEGFSSHIYHDSVGVRTIGFGTTEADVSPLPAFMNRHTAELFLAKRLQGKYLPPIDALGVKFNDNQKSALLSFDYNLGPNIFNGTDIGTALRAHHFLEAANDMLEFDHAGGVVLPGLLFRRRDERRLFLEPVPVVDPNNYMRFIDANFKFFGGKHWINERKTVELYDRYRLHPHLHIRELHAIRRDLEYLWKRIYIVTTHGNQKAEWKFAYRGYRLQQIKHRAEGQRVHVDFKP